MHTIEYFRKLINKSLSELLLNGSPAELYEPIDYTIKLGGKRMRPVLTLLACDLFGGNIRKALSPALAIEIFHNFTLIHDDIMDAAPLRRGNETVYRKWNTNIAILSGDTMFAIAYQYVCRTDEKHLKDILEVFTQTAIEVCEGQQYDLNFETNADVSISDYLEMIRLKTAVLLGASLKIGAIIGGASKKDADHIYDFGINMGLAFQLKDDLLDTFGDASSFGKKTGNDIATNKKTYLYLNALKLANPTQHKLLKDLYTKTQFGSLAEKMESVIQIFNALQIDVITEQAVNHYHHTALKHLAAIQVDEAKKIELIAFSEMLKTRNI